MKSPHRLIDRARRLAAFGVLLALPLGLALVAMAQPAPADDAQGATATGRTSTRGGHAAQPVRRTQPRTRTAARTTASANARWGTDFEQARRLSKQTGKPILVNFSGSDWCGWCIRLDSEVFRTSTFKRWAADNVVLLEVDFPRRGQTASQTRKNRALQTRYGVRGFPTVLFLDCDGKELGRSGYQKGGADAWTKSASAKLRGRSSRVPATARR